MKDINHIINKIGTPCFPKGQTLMVLFGVIFQVLSSCDTSVPGSFIGEDAVTISRYLEENQETYSLFWEFLVRTDLSNTLNAYNPNGNGYTLFAPTNEAINAYIEQNENYTSFNDLLDDSNFSNLLIRYHLVNTSISTNDFPYGALPDTTVTGDFLTVGFDDSGDSIVYRINNQAPVTVPNIELINGYIHVIGEVLEPVTNSSFDWILNNPDFSIIAEGFRLTGIQDTMGVFRTTASGKVVSNLYTVLVEPDSIFNKHGIMNIDDLIDQYQTPGLELTNFENGFYQFMAYHLLDGSYFLDEFNETKNYNTYANFPVQIAAGLEIRINPGKDTLDIIIEGQDTTAINYVRIDMINSNILTKNGPLHLLKDILEVKTPGRTIRTFQFLEEPLINEASKEQGEYIFADQSDMEVLSWTGLDFITYVKASSMPANNNDYIELEGNFTIEYIMPKILPGKYLIEFRAERSDGENATIQVSIDGKRLGSSFDLTSGGNPYNTFIIGIVEFQNYESHVVTVNSLLPGSFSWDFIQFTPE